MYSIDAQTPSPAKFTSCSSIDSRAHQLKPSCFLSFTLQKSSIMASEQQGNGKSCHLCCRANSYGRPQFSLELSEEADCTIWTTFPSCTYAVYLVILNTADYSSKHVNPETVSILASARTGLLKISFLTSPGAILVRLLLFVPFPRVHKSLSSLDMVLDTHSHPRLSHAAPTSRP